MDGTGSGLCEVAGFWISGAELFGYIASWLTAIRKEGSHKMTFFSHE
jgi:hypothetical protein